jgi:hypothetical protein
MTLEDLSKEWWSKVVKSYIENSGQHGWNDSNHFEEFKRLVQSGKYDTVINSREHLKHYPECSDIGRKVLGCTCETAILEALCYIHEKSYPYILVLLDQGADVDKRGSFLQSLFEKAAKFGYWDVARLLMERGAHCATNLRRRHLNPKVRDRPDTIEFFKDEELRKRNVIAMKCRRDMGDEEEVQLFGGSAVMPRDAVEIFCMIGRSDLLNARLVCKTWRRLIDASLERRPASFFNHLDIEPDHGLTYAPCKMQ